MFNVTQNSLRTGFQQETWNMLDDDMRDNSAKYTLVFGLLIARVRVIVRRKVWVKIEKGCGVSFLKVLGSITQQP